MKTRNFASDVVRDFTLHKNTLAKREKRDLCVALVQDAKEITKDTGKNIDGYAIVYYRKEAHGQIIMSNIVYNMRDSMDKYALPGLLHHKLKQNGEFGDM